MSSPTTIGSDAILIGLDFKTSIHNAAISSDTNSCILVENSILEKILDSNNILVLII